MHVSPELRTRAQPRKRADPRVFADRDARLFAVNVRKGLDHCAAFNHAIGDDALRADARAVAELHPALKHAVHINFHIAAAFQRAAHIQPRRVLQAHAAFHQRLCNPHLVRAFQLGQLGRAVNTGHLQRVGDGVCRHFYAIGHGHAHHIGQVELALRIAVIQPRQPAFERARRGRHDAAVDLGHRALRLAGVFVLDDGLHRVTLAQHPPIPAGVGEMDGEQSQPLPAACRHQRAQCVGVNQGYVAR